MVRAAAAGKSRSEPASTYVEVAPKQEAVSMPTITYAQVGRSPSTDATAAATTEQPKAVSLPNFTYVEVGRSSTSKSASPPGSPDLPPPPDNAGSKKRAKKQHEKKKTTNGQAQLPTSQYADVSAPPPQQQQQQLPQQKSMVFDEAYVSLEPRTDSEPQIVMTAKEWKESERAKQLESKRGANGYEEVTTPPALVRPQDAGYFAV
jgi:hypothetical protein